MSRVRKPQPGITAVESYHGRCGVDARALPEQYLVQFGQNCVTWKSVHTVAHGAVEAVRYRADIRAVTLDIAQDEPRNQVVLAGSDIADIAALGAIGGAAVDADRQSRRANIMAGVFVPAPNTIAGKAVSRIV
jgi:hypothetical protein